ncbi:hypothetical protein [Flavobacterium sp. GCM10023249]|uniref:hypothetical protein n=1 Tax=unclassified Flavobacterium TaxID=196869 RepID=UPI00360F2089
MIKKIVPLSLVFCLTSCVGYWSSATFTDLSDKKVQMTKLEEENCLKSETEVTLLFDGEPINFEYERIGLIEAEGGTSSTDEDVLKELKLTAKSKCCDAIIGIRKGKTTTNAGLLFIPESKDRYDYTVSTFTGIAVKRKNTVN